MLEREIVVPADRSQLWEVLTDPDRIEGWFGAEVEWDVRPGGAARFRQPDGARREGRIEEVDEGRWLRFRWWPEGERADRSSEVTYRLDPDEGGTRLTVQERPVGPGVAEASASTGWTRWDTCLLGLWGLLALPVAVAAH